MKLYGSEQMLVLLETVNLMSDFHPSSHVVRKQPSHSCEENNSGNCQSPYEVHPAEQPDSVVVSLWSRRVDFVPVILSERQED